MKTRRIAWAVLVLLLCASFLSIVAFASSFSDGSGGTVELEVTNADVSSDGILTKRIYGSQKTSFGITSGQRKDVTITIKNNNAFDVKLSGPMTFNIVGGKFQLSGTGYYKINSESEVKKENCTDVINADYIIEAGKSMTIKLTSPGGNDCYTEISWPIVAKKYVTYDINFAPAEHGSYAVDGVAITETTTKGIEGATGAELSATPDEGYVCVGFADATTGKMVLGMDSTQTTTFYPGSSMTIVPVFVQGLTETPYLIGTDSYYYTWESAMVAGRGGIVILNQNYTLPTTLTENGLTAAGNYVTGTDGALTYTVPTGTSLLVPYDSNNVFRGVATRYTLEKMDLQATDFPTSPEHSIIWVRAEAENPPTEYRRLTLPANTHLVVNGSLEVSGQSQALGKGHWGKYGLIQMEQGSKITVNNGATLFSWGFIRGNGTVEAMPGSSVYEPFSIADYPAGGVGTMNDMNNNNILAFKEYTVHGVEVPLTIHYNTSHYIYFCISGYNVGYNTYHVPFAGNNDTSLIKLAEGATLTKSYKDGRMQLTFSGDATFNAFTIEISALIYTYKLDINKTGFAVSSSWDVLIKGGSDVVSKVSMPLLAGSNVTIEEGATLEIASGKNFYIFDAEDDPSNATADAKLDVNGTVVVNGGLYTTTNGAEITSSKGTGKVIQNTQGTATSVAIMKDNASSDTYAINQAWLLNGDNTTYVKTADNTTIPNTYTYTDEKWVCQTHTWDNACDTECNVCGETRTITHAYVKTTTATCTEAGIATYTCSVCGHSYTEEEAALGHSFTNYVNNHNATCQKNSTETAKCDRCDVTDEREAEGTQVNHKYTDYTSDNNATCLQNGTKTASCDFGCGSTDTITDEGTQLTHSYVTYTYNNDATCQKDGTETAFCEYNCGNSNSRTAANTQTDHVYSNYTYNEDASCTKPGTKSALCDFGCGTKNTVNDAEHPILAHSFTNYVYDGNATKEQSGTATAVCDNGCGAKDTKEVTLPEAEVKSLGKITVSPEGEYAFEDSYYVYDLIHGTELSVSSEPFDMTIAMEFVAKETAEQAAENFFGNYTTDFFITLNGMANGSFVGDGCYLAGYYPSYRYWVKIPLDGFTVENGKVYPVITSAGLDFKYVDICASVEQFICGIYIAPEILEANPDLSVTLSLGLSEDKEAAQSANFITVDSYTYNSKQLHVHTYDAVVTAPTCGAKGYTTYTCSACGDSYVADETEMVAHTPAEAVKENEKAATCTTAGSYDSVVYCSVCKTYEISRETVTVDALGHSYDDGVVTTEPTCTEAGVKTFTCGVCGDKYTEKIAATGHNYVDGLCSVCGEADETELTDEDLKFWKTSLSFQEYIGLQFIAKQSVLSGYDSHYAVIIQQKPNADKGEVTGYVDERVEMSGEISGSYYKFNKNIQSWSMTDVVTITLYGVKNGVTYKGETITTSVMEQAYLKLEEFAGNTSRCKVLADMLTYGAAVQVAFNHDILDLPNAKLEELGYSSFVTTSIPEITAVNTVMGTGSMTVSKTSLSLQEKVDLQLIFGKDMSGYKAVVTLTDGETFEISPDGRKFSLVALPYKMRETYTVVICNAETGEVVSPTYTYSIESVAREKLGNSEAYDNLIYAMLNYGDSVKAIV